MAGFNGSGQFSFTYNWVNDSQNGVPITASRMDGQFNDAVSGFDLCITRDGQGAPSVAIPFPGVSDASSAASGYIGQVLSSDVPTGSSVALTTAASVDITSVSLTAGDWDVWGNVIFDSASGTTTISLLRGWISATSATIPTSFTNGGAFVSQLYPSSLIATADIALPVGMKTISIASTTTIYLSVNATFATAAYKGYGTIFARRAR